MSFGGHCIQVERDFAGYLVFELGGSEDAELHGLVSADKQEVGDSARELRRSGVPVATKGFDGKSNSPRIDMSEV